MEPVEINAGRWYLRGLRADERVDDRPVLLTAALDGDTARWASSLVFGDLAAAGDHVTRRQQGWVDDTWFAWAVCEPTTGEMLAEVGLRDVDLHAHHAELTCWTAPAHRGRGVMGAAARAVLGLAFAGERLGGLGLHRVEYRHAASNAGSARLAASLGFTPEGTLRDAVYWDGAFEDQLVLARLASD